MLESLLMSLLVAFPNAVSCFVEGPQGRIQGCGVLYYHQKHVGEGSITLMSWSRVLGCAAGVGLVKVIIEEQAVRLVQSRSIARIAYSLTILFRAPDSNLFTVVS